MLIASIFMLWVIVVLLVIAVFALARQIGVLRERIATMGVQLTDSGPKAGDIAPRVHATTIDGRPLTIGPGHMGPLTTLLLFVAPGCPICRKIVPLAKAVAAKRRLDLVFIGDGDLEEQRAMAARHKLTDYSFANSPEASLAFHAGKLPYGVLIRSDGVVASKGMVKSREHLESLVVANETDSPTAPAHLRHARTIEAAE